MCKARSIKYACGHTFYFRLSTCSGSILICWKPKRAPKVACSTAPLLTFRSSSRCGPCLAAEAEESMARKIAEHRSRASQGEAVDIAALLAEEAALQFQLEKRYPRDQRFKRFAQPWESPRANKLEKSPLKFEMQQLGDDEDESEDSKASAASYAEWADQWNRSETSFATGPDGEDIEDELASADNECSLAAAGLIEEYVMSWSVEEEKPFVDKQSTNTHTIYEPGSRGQPTLSKTPSIGGLLVEGQKESMEHDTNRARYPTILERRRCKSLSTRSRTPLDHVKVQVELVERFRGLHAGIAISS